MYTDIKAAAGTRMERRRYLQTVGGIGVAIAGGTGVYERYFTGPDWETRDGWLLSGAAPSDQDFSVFDHFEEWLGQRHAVTGRFVDIGIPDSDIESAVFSGFESIWQRGQVPLVWWQPFFGGRDSTSQSVTRDIANGDHDETLQMWADTLARWANRDREYDRRLYLNLAPELNGDWSPWSPAVGDDDEADYVAMWHRIHDMLVDAGLKSDQVKWVWTLDTTTRDVDPEAAYPGDDYVDWIAVHGYNWTSWETWKTPEELYGSTFDRIRSIADKPLAVTEFGCSSEMAEGEHDPARKDEWVADVYDYFEESELQMALWFNVDAETDWAVFGSEYGAETASVGGTEYDVYPAYREALSGDGVLGPHPKHPRVLTDAEFAGEF